MVRKISMNLFSNPCVLFICFIGFLQSRAVYMQYNTLKRAPVVHDFSQELKSDLVLKELLFF